jgi:hypothetical protein
LKDGIKCSIINKLNEYKGKKGLNKTIKISDPNSYRIPGMPVELTTEEVFALPLVPLLLVIPDARQ